MIQVAVMVDRPFARERRQTVDDAGVVQGVREDNVPPHGQRRQDANVRLIAGRKQDRRLAPLERGGRLLGFGVNPKRPGDQARRAAAAPYASIALIPAATSAGWAARPR